MVRGVFLNSVSYLVSPQLNKLVWGVMDTSQKSGNQTNEWFSGFPKVKLKSYWAKMKQNDSTEFSGHSFLKCCWPRLLLMSLEKNGFGFPGAAGPCLRAVFKQRKLK